MKTITILALLVAALLSACGGCGDDDCEYLNERKGVQPIDGAASGVKQ